MKNYEVLEGIKKNQRDVIDAAYNKGYDQGFIDGRYSAELIDELKEQEYKRGFRDGAADVWIIVKKIILPVASGGASPDELKKFFGTSNAYAIISLPLSEALDRFKKYKTKKPPVLEDMTKEELIQIVEELTDLTDKT